MIHPSRRDALRITGLAAAAAVLGRPATTLAAPRSPARTRAIRLAHLTDTHTQPERRADEGLTACLRHIHSLADKPDLLISGGDHIFDALAADQARTKLQWGLWHDITKSECTIPIAPCIGNHDIWGWNKPKSGASGDEPSYGKLWATEALGLAAPYRSFDKAGWHFVFLDSVFPAGNGYTAKLDDEQFEWLAGDLAATDPATPVIIVSHIPILSVAVLYFGDKDTRDTNTVDPALMHTDSSRIHRLFLKHKNIRLCISGHLHLIDRCEFDGITYICSGAVSGNWWRGRHQQCDEGYNLIDLFDDGAFETRYTTYGWKA